MILLEKNYCFMLIEKKLVNFKEKIKLFKIFKNNMFFLKKINI